MKLTADHTRVAMPEDSTVKKIWGNVWQEDDEIEFLQLAEQGIPESFKDEGGVPLDKPQVRTYLKDLYNKNSAALINVSDRFMNAFDEL